jgi:hypothetical protein
MKFHIASVMVGFLSLVPMTLAQMPAQTASALPRLVRFAGTAQDLSGTPLTGVVGITFAFYSEKTGGAPLWLETQNATADSAGHYTVLLGATKPEGLPAELFTSEQARWVGVQVSGQPEQPRVLLVSAPYALKAADAETLGGLPPSAFALAAPTAVGSSASNPTTETVTPLAATDVTTTGGTLNYLPIFSGAATILNSSVFQTGSGTSGKIGIDTTTPATQLDVNGAGTVRGTLNLPPTGTATATAGDVSQGLNFVASSYNSTSATAVNQTFRWHAEPAANDTTAPSGTLNLLFGTGTATPSETGLKISSKGIVTFATGQTFPGAGTLTGITTAAGSGLSGGGATGTLSLKVPAAGITNTMLVDSKITLNANAAGGLTTPGAMTLGSTYTIGIKPCAANQILQYTGTTWNCVAPSGTGTITGVTAGTDLTGGGTAGKVTLNLDTTKVPLLASRNTFTGTNVFNQSTAADAVDAYTTGPGKSALVGLEYATSGGSYGVYAITYDSTGAGVAGINNSPAAEGPGLFGRNGAESVTGQTYANYGAGAWGDGGATSGNPAVMGTADDGAAGFLVNNSPSGYVTLYVTSRNSFTDPFIAQGPNGTCIIGQNGNLGCSGTKSAIVPVDNGKRTVALSAIEAPQNWFEDFGEAQLVHGAAIVPLDSTYIQTVNTEMKYQVFLTPYSDCKGLYVANRTANSFEVHELGGGTASLSFGYRIAVLRKNYENVRFDDRTREMERSKHVRMQSGAPHPVSHDPVKKPG